MISGSLSHGKNYKQMVGVGEHLDIKEGVFFIKHISEFTSWEARRLIFLVNAFLYHVNINLQLAL